MHGDARITNDIAQAVDTIVAIPVGDHKRFFVNDAHEAWEVAARRAIHAIRTDSCKRQVWGRANIRYGAARIKAWYGAISVSVSFASEAQIGAS